MMLDTITRLARAAGLSVNRVREIADGYLVPWYARSIPSAPITRGTGPIELGADEEETERIDVDFPYPVIITGFSFTITSSTFGNLDDLDLGDLLVRLDTYDGEQLLTTVQSATGVTTVNFVPARSLDATVRQHVIRIDRGGGERVRVGYTFRSRYAAGGTSGFGEPVLITADAMAIPDPFCFAGERNQ